MLMTTGKKTKNNKLRRKQRSNHVNGEFKIYHWKKKKKTWGKTTWQQPWWQKEGHTQGRLFELERNQILIATQIWWVIWWLKYYIWDWTITSIWAMILDLMVNILVRYVLRLNQISPPACTLSQCLHINNYLTDQLLTIKLRNNIKNKKIESIKLRQNIVPKVKALETNWWSTIKSVFIRMITITTATILEYKNNLN